MGNRYSEDRRRRKTEDGRRKMEDGRWETEDGRWKTEDGRMMLGIKSSGGSSSSSIRFMSEVESTHQPIKQLTN